MTDFKDGDRVRIAEGATFSGDEGVIPSVGDGQEGVVEWGWALEDWEVALLTEPDQMDRDDLDDPFDDFYALDEMGEVPAQVSQPSHYQSASGLEAIDVIEGFDLNYRLGNVCKYVLRAGKKGDAVEDLLKARQYLNREINAREGRASW